VAVRVGVFVGVAVMVGVGVLVGVSVNVGVAVSVEPNNWPGLQALIDTNKIMSATIERCFMILPPWI
jgi:hypothetical protein